jgi:hypothetical protein
MSDSLVSLLIDVGGPQRSGTFGALFIATPNAAISPHESVALAHRATEIEEDNALRYPL